MEAGREFVEAYVQYMRYIDVIHTAMMSAGVHNHTSSGESVAPATKVKGEADLE